MKSKNTMRGARLEPDSGYVQYLDACAAFLSRANHVLEEITAFDELEELARHDSAGDRAAIEAWARTWGVNAPCMRQAAQDIVDATRRDPANSGFRHVSRNEAMGEPWRRQLVAWNEFPVTMSARPARGQLHRSSSRAALGAAPHPGPDRDQSPKRTAGAISGTRASPLGGA